ncbi:flagellar basal-body MS-ring/collar protein FliF [Allosphingosinicella sp.]|uniref:flagellar basal-body MS-ring/collar protein FliF n=1 Tax=Allosphingosinicella sp. TaxID=2823234 RepID=UPI00378497E8
MTDTTLNDLTPIPARASALPPRSGGIMQSVRSFTAQPAVAKSLPLLGLLAVLGAIALIWMTVAGAPSRTLFSGLPDSDKGAVVEALNGAGIANSLDRDTGAIKVSDDDYHRARMLLAAQGLPRGGQSGADVVADMPLGASRAVEAERIRAAREADLARTIEAIDVVQTARVHLAAEQPSVFVRERSNAAASVMLTLAPGRTLGEGQTQAIVNLVASSVPGLAPEQVSVIDQNGRLLSNSGGNAASQASERQLAIQNQVEDRARQAITTLLTPIVGAGNFTTEVHAEMDFSEVQSTREGFPENQRQMTAEEGQVSSEGGANGAPPAGGVPGALSNTPPPAAQVAAAPGGAVTVPAQGAPSGATPAAAGANRNENYNRTYAVGREVSVTRAQTGTVKRLSVAVALRQPDGRPRGVAEMQQLEQLVRGAVGFDQARGDVVALTSRAFAATEEASTSWWEAGWVSLVVRNLTALVIAILFIFVFAKPLLKKTQAALANRSAGNRTARAGVGGEIANAIADRVDRHGNNELDVKVTMEMIEATRDYEKRAALIRAFVRQDPARAALVVRDLIRADAGASANG